MSLGKIVLSIGFILSLSGEAFANRTFIDFDLRALEGANEGTTKAIAQEIENQVIRQCRAISSFDKVELVSEVVTDRMVKQHTVSSPAECDLNLPGCSGASYPVGKADVFRYSNIVLRRTDSAGRYSYTIKIETNWGLDLPAPQAEVTIQQSEYCKLKAL